jgi:uracil-DNA glycosylase
MGVGVIDTWEKFIASQFEEEYFQELDAFLRNEAKRHTIYPKQEDVFRAFELTPLEEVKCVILGQDCYHTPGVATGLAFSVSADRKIPPSLRNIFQEIKDDLKLGEDFEFKNGELTPWSRQGVLLLNSILTVRKGEPGSHSKSGWAKFTDAAIQLLNEQQRPIVFLLFGAYAQSKAKLLNNSKHLIIEAPHPSPFSAHTGFFGSRCFSRANAFLESKGMRAINWRL